MDIKIGTIVGNWIVISEKFKENNLNWNLCECICGKRENIQHYYLNNYKTKGCGCTEIKLRFKNKTVGDLSLAYYNSFKSARIRKGFSFSEEITPEFLWNLFLVQNRKCALSGIDLILSPRWNKKYKGEFSKLQTASIDRKDSFKDYTKDNIQWVHKQVNYMKGQLTDNEFIKLCKLIANNNI